jgi:hypothetical protein
MIVHHRRSIATDTETAIFTCVCTDSYTPLSIQKAVSHTLLQLRMPFSRVSTAWALGIGQAATRWCRCDRLSRTASDGNFQLRPGRGWQMDKVWADPYFTVRYLRHEMDSYRNRPSSAGMGWMDIGHQLVKRLRQWAKAQEKDSPLISPCTWVFQSLSRVFILCCLETNSSFTSDQLPSSEINSCQDMLRPEFVHS